MSLTKYNVKASPKSIYLAGPITGLDYAEARYTWRDAFAKRMNELAAHVECYSPMRQKDFLEGQQCPGTAQELEQMENALARPHGILTRDFNDVCHRDAMVACFLGAQRVSIGTVWEIGVAFSKQKPLIVVMEPGHINVHDHVFITHTAGYVVPTLEEAAFIAASILTPGV